MSLESLKLVKELSKTDKSMGEQLRTFKEKTGKHTATFYRQRKKLGIVKRPGMISDGLRLVNELANTNKSKREQLRIFKEKTGKHIATFYRQRKKLRMIRRNIPSEGNFYRLIDKEKCYFCLREGTDNHHINRNRKDNSDENLVLLCRGCHSKVHRILKNVHSLL